MNAAPPINNFLVGNGIGGDICLDGLDRYFVGASRKEINAANDQEEEKYQENQASRHGYSE